MSDLDRFIVENNVSNFFSQLASESDIAKRVILSRLLVEEEYRFAREVKYLDKFDLYLARCDAQIAKHRALLNGPRLPEVTKAQFFGVLRNMEAIRTILHENKKLAADRLNALMGP